MEPGVLIQPRETAMERLPIADGSREPTAEGACHLDEAAVVARAQRDPTAFAPLYMAYVEPVYRYCYRRLGSREAAQDATSLVFERALRSLATFRGGSFRGWLFTIAHNAVTDAYRRRGTNLPFIAAMEVPDPAPPPEQVAILADEQRLLATALALLPADQRHVIELRLSGIPSVEVAAILERSPQAVRALQLRATRRLRTLLAPSIEAKEVRDA
jgi:RNA polymerase sigma-70 factor (ECF subfamily)